MVTPTNGTALFIGQSGARYPIDFYISDVTGAYTTFATQGKAGSTSSTYVTFNEAVVLADLSIATGPTVMVGLTFLSNENLVQNAAIRIANYLNSIQSRPPVGVGFKAGKRVEFTQF